MMKPMAHNNRCRNCIWIGTKASRRLKPAAQNGRGFAVRYSSFMIVLTLGLVVVGVAQEKLHRTAHNDMALLSWLAGCWEGPFENGRWEVCYTTPDWGQMLGANKEIVGGKVNMIEFEHFTIVDDRLVITVTGIERGQDKTLTLDLTRRS